MSDMPLFVREADEEIAALKDRIAELEVELAGWHYDYYRLESAVRFVNKENPLKYEPHPLLVKEK